MRMFNAHRQGGGQAPTPAATRASVPAGVTAATVDGEVERVPVTHLRKVIANAMRYSKQHSAHVTHVDEADVTDLMDHYRRAKPVIEERTGVRFTVLPFFIKALVATLKKYPIFNASVDEERQEILFKKYYNIGIAVDTPEGLIVPVIRNADRKDMVDIAAEVADKADAPAIGSSRSTNSRAAPARSPTSARWAGCSRRRSSTSRSWPSSGCTPSRNGRRLWTARSRSAR